MALDRSRADELIEKYSSALRYMFGLRSWELYTRYKPLKKRVVANVKVDYAYMRAYINFDLSKFDEHDDAAFVSAFIHELLHVGQYVIEDSADKLRQVLKIGRQTRLLNQCVYTIREHLVQYWDLFFSRAGMSGLTFAEFALKRYKTNAQSILGLIDHEDQEPLHDDEIYAIRRFPEPPADHMPHASSGTQRVLTSYTNGMRAASMERIGERKIVLTEKDSPGNCNDVHCDVFAWGRAVGEVPHHRHVRTAYIDESEFLKDGMMTKEKMQAVDDDAR